MTIQDLPKPGSTISAFCDDVKVEGDVLCVDKTRNLIVLQTPSSSGRVDACDILLLRGDLLRDLKTSKVGIPPACPDLDIAKIGERIRTKEHSQQEKLKFYRPNVPPEARELAEHIEKTLSGVVWDDPNIIVMEHTIIKPPYKDEHIVPKSDTQQAKKQTDYVQKIVSRFFKDRESTAR